MIDEKNRIRDRGEYVDYVWEGVLIVCGAFRVH